MASFAVNGTEEGCPECGAGVVKLWFEMGHTIHCSKYPGKCRYVRHVPYGTAVKTIEEREKK